MVPARSDHVARESVWRVRPATSVQGMVEVPGDKSVAIRLILLSILSKLPVSIKNVPDGGDVVSALAAVERLGAKVENDLASHHTKIITGVGFEGMQGGTADEPLVIDCGNSASVARMLAGLLVAQKGHFMIVGDDSLSVRPMARVVEPLKFMGASITCSPSGTLPIRINGVGGDGVLSPLRGGDLEIDVSSAQIKSAVLFASLFSSEEVRYFEPARSRDHSENILRELGVSVLSDDNSCVASADPLTSDKQDAFSERFSAMRPVIPGDPSSAAPFIVAGALLPGSIIRLPGVTLNPTRTGLISILERMGGRIAIENRQTFIDGEIVADLEVTHSELMRAVVEPEEIPSLIDEVPLLALLLSSCRGESFIRGVGELRYKESDRLAETVSILKRVGISAEERKDSIVVRGSGQRHQGGMVSCSGDHRMAMLAGAAGVTSRSGVEVVGAECVDVSYPGFFRVIDRLSNF